MPAQPRLNEPKEKEKIVVDVHKCNCEKSWRSRSVRREAELLKTFGPDHGWGISILKGVIALNETDADGNQFIDDGSATIHTLSRMKTDWQSDSNRMPDCYFDGDLPEEDEAFEWDSNLVVIFQEGLKMRVMQWDDDSHDARAVWHAKAHDENSNKFRVTGIPELHAVATYALGCCNQKREDAIRWLTQRFGVGARSTAARWVDLALALDLRKSELTMQELSREPFLPAGYIMFNPFFVSRGVEASKRLSDGYAVRAIRHMKEEIEMRAGAQVRKDQPESTQEKFQKWHCTYLKCIESWEKICRKKFGATARDSVSLSRVIDRLCSLPGLQSVESCVASRTPLQGTSDANPGISECRALWQQYEQVLSGGPAPSVSLGAVETAPESSVDLLAVEAALESRASSVADGLGSRLGDEEQQLLSQSRSEVDSITFCSQASEVLEIM